MKTFRDLDVWKKSVDFATHIYSLTSCFPTEEKYGLSSQIQRAVVLISSNIAEGSKRGSKKEFAHFLRIAQGSGAELETQLRIASNLSYVDKELLNLTINQLDDIMRMLTGLINSLKD